MGLIAQLKRVRNHLSECPHPNKVRFHSEGAAERRAAQLGMEHYKCVCGKWHLTGQCTHHFDDEVLCHVCGLPDYLCNNEDH